MDKVKLDVKGKEAAIIEGGDSFLGKVLTNHKGKIKIHMQGVHREVKIVDELKPKKDKK